MPLRRRCRNRAAEHSRLIRRVARTAKRGLRCSSIPVLVALIAWSSAWAGDRCTIPGITIVTDVANDQTGAAQLDIQSISIAQPADPSSSAIKLFMTLKVANLDPVPQADSSWIIYFTRFVGPYGNDTQFFLAMSTVAPASSSAPAFIYGHTAGVNNDLVVDGVADSGVYHADGTITIAISNPTTNPGGQAFPPFLNGELLANVSGETRMLAGGTTSSADKTGKARYTVTYNGSCTAESQNISTRLEVLTGDNVMIGGFIVRGSLAEKVVVRAIGPSTGIAGALADPTLELHMPDGSIVTNDNWQVDDATGQSQEADVQATGVAPADDRESALVQTLNPGSYTAIVRGKGGATGIALVEIYDIGDTASNLANISTRGFVDTGDNVMIGGFIIGPASTMASRIGVRAIGPSSGVAGALQDPVLELHDSNGGVIATNDNWQDDSSAADVQSYGLAPADARESAMMRTLAPGAYTSVVRGANSATGVGLVEVYNLR